MPQDRPGSLSAEEYADVVAYILRLNGRPAGERELPADAALLARMRW
jgi:S-disulfanyl-L-cysteine oxidoreductase SoxD